MHFLPRQKEHNRMTWRLAANTAPTATRFDTVSVSTTFVSQSVQLIHSIKETAGFCRPDDTSCYLIWNKHTQTLVNLTGKE
jgi:hypothetical protein